MDPSPEVCGEAALASFSIFATFPAKYFHSWVGPFVDQVIGTAFLVGFIGPRLWAWIAGWKTIAMPGDYGNVNTYFWIPIVGPLVGAAVGALIYDLGIRDVLIARGATPEPEVEERGVDALEEPGGAASEHTEAGGRRA